MKNEEEKKKHFDYRSLGPLPKTRTLLILSYPRQNSLCTILSLTVLLSLSFSSPSQVFFYSLNSSSQLCNIDIISSSLGSLPNLTAVFYSSIILRVLLKRDIIQRKKFIQPSARHASYTILIIFESSIGSSLL